jgi:hypothetical protein
MVRRSRRLRLIMIIKIVRVAKIATSTQNVINLHAKLSSFLDGVRVTGVVLTTGFVVLLATGVDIVVAPQKLSKHWQTSVVLQMPIPWQIIARGPAFEKTSRERGVQ